MRQGKGPGGDSGALESIATDHGQSNRVGRSGVAFADLEAQALAAGYRLAVQCLDCNAWLVSAKSVAAHRGPVCRGRRGGAA